MTNLSAIDVLCARSDAPAEVLNALREKLAPLRDNEQLKADFLKAQIDYGVFDADAMAHFIKIQEGKLADLETTLRDTLN